MTKNIIVLVGPSGSGKTTIGDRLTRKGVKKLVTTTTRKPRKGEKDGVDYYFREKNELNAEDFIEQTEYNNKIYGLTKSEVENALENHQFVHVSLDRNGAKVIKEQYPEEAVVFFITITIDQMIERMEKRGDSAEKIDERIKFCEVSGELSPPPETDFVIKNTDIDSTVQEIIGRIKQKVNQS